MNVVRTWRAVAALLSLALALVAPVAFAADAAVKWTAPTLNADGTAIPATGAGALTAYLIEWGTCTTAAGVVPQVLGTVSGSLNVAAPATQATVTGLTPATIYCLRMYALAGAAKSAPSGVVRAWIPAASTVPGAPTGVTVVAVGTAP